MKRSTRLEWNDTSHLPDKWPWSMHWSLSDENGEKELVDRISAVDKWVDDNEVNVNV